MANLTSFIAALKDGGARANQFEVRIGGPGAAVATIVSDFRFLVKATTVPSFTIGEIAVPYRGRQVFVSGDRTYDTWSITVMADQDMNFYKAFAAIPHLVHRFGDRPPIRRVRANTAKSDNSASSLCGWFAKQVVPLGFHCTAQPMLRVIRNDSILRICSICTEIPLKSR